MLARSILSELRLEQQCVGDNPATLFEFAHAAAQRDACKDDVYKMNGTPMQHVTAMWAVQKLGWAWILDSKRGGRPQRGLLQGPAGHVGAQMTRSQLPEQQLDARAAERPSPCSGASCVMPSMSSCFSSEKAKRSRMHLARSGCNGCSSALKGAPDSVVLRALERCCCCAPA